MKKKSIIRIAVVTAAILMVPLVAMQFTNEVNWSAGDFLIMGLLIFGTGISFGFLAKGGNGFYRLGLALAVATGFLLIWGNLAVGIVGSGPNAANLMYGIVPVIGFFGALMGHPNPRKMANAAFATAVAQGLVPLIALIIWRPGTSPLNEAPGIMGVFALNTVFVVLWAASGFLFRRAAAVGPGSKTLA